VDGRKENRFRVLSINQPNYSTGQQMLQILLLAGNMIDAKIHFVICKLFPGVDFRFT